MEHYEGKKIEKIKAPLMDKKDFSKNVPAWDAKFVDVKPDDLDTLIVASYYLDILVLVHLFCAKYVSVHMNEETAEEVIKKYGTLETETPEMKKKINEMFPSLA